jgi:P27 family predicted phage terminase small subunit
MPKGRKPMPDAMRLVKYSQPAKERMNFDQPEYGIEIQCPDHFDEKRRDAWFSLVPNLIRAGVAKEVDVYSLEMLAEKWVEWRDAQDKVNNTGLVTKAPSGYPMMNPYYTISMQIGKELRMMLAEFGMTPSSRQRVVADKPKKVSEFSDIS